MSMEVKSLLSVYILFFKIWASKLGTCLWVWLIYMDFYGNGEQMRDNKVQIYNFKCVTVGG